MPWEWERRWGGKRGWLIRDIDGIGWDFGWDCAWDRIGLWMDWIGPDGTGSDGTGWDRVGRCTFWIKEMGLNLHSVQMDVHVIECDLPAL
jgi:hypothetical protein